MLVRLIAATLFSTLAVQAIPLNLMAPFTNSHVPAPPYSLTLLQQASHPGLAIGPPDVTVNNKGKHKGKTGLFGVDAGKKKLVFNTQGKFMVSLCLFY
jgi:hypothetical protein